MNTTATRLAALGLFLLVGGSLTWFLFGSGDSAPQRRTAAGPSALAPTDAGSAGTNLVGGADVRGGEATPAGRREGVLSTFDETSVAKQRGEVVAWTGRVRWASGTPKDERAEVLIFDRLGERAPFWDPEATTIAASIVARVPVEADGTFTIDVPTSGERWIDLRARYGYLERPLVLPPTPNAELELRPSLGAWLVGSAKPPAGVELADLASGEIQLSRTGAAMDFRRMMDSSGRELATELDTSARFELGGVPAGGYKLELASDFAAPFEQDALTLRAGTKLAVELPLAPGARLAGRVLDQDGAPLADLRVRARPKSGNAQRRGFGPGGNDRREPTTRTDADGRFVLGGVPAGALELEASGAPLLEDASLELELAAGQALVDLELVGVRGGTLRGRVTWPDGTPAESATVLPRLDTESVPDEDRRAMWGEMQRLRRMETQTDGKGAFELAGLSPERSYTLIATWDARELKDETADPQPTDAKYVGRVESGPFSLDDGSVSLVLEQTRWLVGFVQRPDGAPITAFTIKAQISGSNPFAARFGGNAPVEEPFENERGEFTLVGLSEGTWELTVEAPGFAPPAEAIEIVWPAALETDPPVIRMVPEARIVARVVDPSGRVVPGAEVRDVATGMRERMSGQGRDLSARADAFGLVELAGLSAGIFKLAAYADGFAPSEPLELVLAAGDLHPNVTLALTLGGRIEGTLLSPDGDVADRMVFLGGEGGAQMENGQLATTDAKGGFLLEAVPAGKWNVMAPPSGGFGGGRPSMAGLETASVEVREGETTYVELGTPPAEPVKVSGRVTAGGEPAEAEVTFLASGDDLLSGLAAASSDASGAYSLTLDGPGTYLASARLDGRQQRSTRFTITVREDMTVDLAVPDGAIEGIVRENGEPKRGVRVSIVPDGPLPAGAMLGAQFERISTNAEGKYRVAGLDPGTYRVTVGGSSGFRGPGGNGATPARQVAAGIEVAKDETTSGVDFDLETPGKLIALVVNAETRQPVGSGAVFVRDEAGRVVNPIALSSRTTDGRFEVDGIAAGRYTLSFRGDALASSESRAIDVLSGETTEVELTATAGSSLVVSVVDGDGEPLDARIEVLDEDGRDFQGMVAMDFGFGPPSGGWTPGQETYGPLAAGTYTVRALASDGRDSSRKVKLSGQPERKLTVRLR